MEPGRLLASGRDGDIFEFGPDLVLRRAHERPVARSAKRGVMAYAAEHGYPVPEIHELRVERHRDRDGTHRRARCMVDAILQRPWTIAARGAHARRPARSAARDPGARLAAAAARRRRPRSCTCDLHPLNVIDAPRAWPGRHRLGERVARRRAERRRAHLRVAHVPACPGRSWRTRPRRRCGRCSRARSSGGTAAAPSTLASRSRPSCKALDANIAPDEVVTMNELAARIARPRRERARTSIVAVGSGMTGPPGPVIPAGPP